ncbi:uncharacterized protein LOC762884 isoform X3 [Strongylocentrotus purpuratus]|nr:uncharacterized protein LOC762884 isoform X3 [Strongylocentrotus purpuratus]
MFHSSPRKTGHGGGIAVLFKSELNLTTKPVSNVTTFESVHVISRTSTLHIVVIYRPPPSTANGLTVPDFLNEFESFLTDLSVLPGKLLVLGDFNFHVDLPAKPDVSAFLQATSSASLHQHVIGPTHSHGHTLDLVFTRETESLIKKCNIYDVQMSDHFVIDVQLDIPLPQPQKILTISRNFKAINKEIFLTALCESILDFNHQGDPESGFKWYNETMQSLLDESAPPTSKERPVRRRMLWYNDDIHLARREKRRAERKWKKTKSDVDRNEFLDKQRYSSNLICRTKIAYFHSTLSSCENKDLYKTVDYLLNRKIPSLPVHDSVETCSFLGLFRLLGVPVIRTFLSAVVQEHEHGALFALLGVLDGLCSFLALPIVNGVYYSTIDVLSTAVFFFMSALLFISIIITGALQCRGFGRENRNRPLSVHADINDETGLLPPENDQ